MQRCPSAPMTNPFELFRTDEIENQPEINLVDFFTLSFLGLTTLLFFSSKINSEIRNLNYIKCLKILKSKEIPSMKNSYPILRKCIKNYNYMI